MSMVCVFTLCILRPASFVKTAVHWSQLNAFSDLAVTEAKVGVITGTVVDVVGMERGGLIGGARGQGEVGVDQSQEEMLLFPGFSGDQQKPQVL